MTAARQSAEPNASYRQIFRSSAIIGVTQAFNILLGIVRNKAVALLLGPSGIGTVGMYTSITGLSGAVFGLGLSSSGVRHIAEASACGDEAAVAEAAGVLRKIAILTSLLATVCVSAFARPISEFVFGDSQFVCGIAIVSLVLLFDGVSNAQKATLQGLRRLGDLARCQVFGAALGTLVGVALILSFGRAGIPPFLLVVSIAGFSWSSWYRWRLGLRPPPLTWKETFARAGRLLSLGSAFMVSSLLVFGVDFGVKTAISRQLGMGSLGLYQATWTLSNLYITVIIGAMAADFYPRLTASASDHVGCNRLVNEQLEMGLLMAVPGIVFTVTFAPWILRLLYASGFDAAAVVVRWQVIGISLRVVSWAPGFIQLAKGRGGVFVAGEVAFSLVQIALLLFCLNRWQLEGVGIAFALSYLFHAFATYWVGRWLSGFRFSRNSRLMIGWSSLVVGVSWTVTRYAANRTGVLVGSLLVALSALVSVIFLKRLLGVDMMSAVRRVVGTGRQRTQ